MFDIRDADPIIRERVESCKMFDSYRLVEVDTYLIHDWKDGKLVCQNERCYTVWKRGAACSNCISRGAVEGGKPLVKLETVDGLIYLIVSMPIAIGGKVMALELIKDVTDHLMVSDSEHLENLVVSGLIQEMNEIVMRDPYTGLYNKRYAEQELCKAVLDWDGKAPLTAAILDIDRFKRVNDTYGHLEGDHVIDVLVGLLKEAARCTGGWTSRLGGDEFLLVCPGVGREAVEEITARLRESLRGEPFCKDGSEYHVSVSAGVEEYRPEFGDWRGLFDAADRRMYLEKGRKFAGGGAWAVRP